MSDRQALREAIVILRLRKGLSQKSLADLASVSDSYLNRIERGHSEVGTATLGRIADGLGVELSRLVALAELLQRQREESSRGPGPRGDAATSDGRPKTEAEVRAEMDRMSHFLGTEGEEDAL